MMAVELVVGGLIVVLGALLARVAWVISRGRCRDKWGADALFGKRGRVHHRGAGARERRALDDGDPGAGPSRAHRPLMPDWTRPAQRFKELTVRPKQSLRGLRAQA